MSLLDTLKSLLGLGSSTQPSEGQRDVGVTVEHDPGGSDGRVETASTAGGTGVAPESETDPETPDPDRKPDRAEPTDEQSVEIPDAEELDRDDEPDEEPTDETPVEIPDAEELADVDEPKTDAEIIDGDDDTAEATSDAEQPEVAESRADEAEVEEPQAEEPGGAQAEESEAEPSETDAPEPDAAGEPTDTIKGIGSTYAERLSAVGIETVGDLATADPADVAGEADISESRLERWVQRARDA